MRFALDGQTTIQDDDVMDSIVNDLLEFFPDNVTIETFISSDGMGASAYVPGGGVVWKARVRGQHKLVRNSDGVDQMSSVNVVFAGAPNCSAKDRFTLPVRFVPQQPKAISIDSSTDENGPHHERVYF